MLMLWSMPTNNKFPCVCVFVWRIENDVERIRLISIANRRRSKLSVVRLIEKRVTDCSSSSSFDDHLFATKCTSVVCVRCVQVIRNISRTKWYLMVSDDTIILFAICRVKCDVYTKLDWKRASGQCRSTVCVWRDVCAAANIKLCV